MNLKGLARDYLRKVKIRREALQLLFDRGSYDDVVREAQEIVELSLKGALRGIGVDPPKKHDVGGLISEYRTKWPKELADQVKDLEGISKTLFEERGHAFYGDETGDVPASELFAIEDAQKALRWTDQTIAFLATVLGKG